MFILDAMTEQDNKKRELLGILNDVEHKAEDIESNGREIVQQGRFIRDLVRLIKEFIQAIPDDSYLSPEKWENPRAVWQNLQKQVSITKIKLEEIKPFVFATDSTSASATVSASSIISIKSISSLPRDVQCPAYKIHDKFEQFLEQSNLIEKITNEIKRLGLSISSTVSESPLSLLKQSEQAFKVPSVNEVAPSAVLIPLREAINRILADMLPRRPNQEETGKSTGKKIRSICTQCSSSTIDSIQIENLTKEADNLNNLFSSSKQAMLTREEVRELMNRGLVLILDFLRMIDEHKMR